MGRVCGSFFDVPRMIEDAGCDWSWICDGIEPDGVFERFVRVPVMCVRFGIWILV